MIPAFGVFDAVSQETLEMFNSAAYYWAGKEPAAQWFAAMPFGLNAQGMNGWYFHGGALSLWEKTYASFNLGFARIVWHTTLPFTSGSL